MTEEMIQLKAEMADLKKDKGTLLDSIEEKEAKIEELNAELSGMAARSGLPPTGKPPIKKK